MLRVAIASLAVILLATPAVAEDYCADASTTPEISACMQEAYEAAAKKLDGVLKPLRGYAVETDEDSNGSYEVAEKFDAAQAAFAAYLEAACDYEAATYTNGTGASAAYNGCKIKLTEQRITHLNPEPAQ